MMPDLLRDSLAGRYTISRQIGRGGMATVFLAHDLKHERDVAVKVLHADLSAAVPAERFHREIRIQARLHHPHVIPLLDSGDANGLLYYIMPYIEGESLRQRLAQGPMDVGEALRLWRDVVDGIAYAHRNGVAHRDIKPENVLLAERHAMVADFGVAKALGGVHRPGDTLTGVGVAIGTPAYMSPEQVSGSGDADLRSDIYSLGILAYEMLAGQPPFTGSTAQSVFAAHISETPRPLGEMRADVPASLAAIVHRCLEKDPAHRWPSADALLAAIDALVTPQPGTNATLPRRRLSRPVLAAIVVAVAAGIAATGYLLVQRRAQERWARDVGLPELRRLTDVRQRDSAFMLGERIRAVLPGDAEVERLWRQNATYLSLVTDPPGALASWAQYAGDTSGWKPIGTTPLDSAPVPPPSLNSFILLKLEKPGYATTMMGVASALRLGDPVRLAPLGDPDSAMVRVPARPVFLNTSDSGGRNVRRGAFAIDRFETTNEQFKRFVDAGGYTRRDLWEPFVLGGRRVSWEDGMRRLVDRTGRPGPATWEGGAPPRGQERLPVSGVSWYEAMAYARFVGRQLPTVHQWRAVAGFNGAAWIVPLSNFAGAAPGVVGEPRGIGPFGTYDMAGNVREWCLNSDGARRYILGGGWSEPPWAFTHTISEDPFDRSPLNGIRLVKPLEDDPNAALLAANLPRVGRDYARERPRPDAEFRVLRDAYTYDNLPLNARIDAVDSANPRFVRQLVSFDAVNGERVRMHLVLPRNATPPYQTMVFLPGANAFSGGSSEELVGFLEFVVVSGRAVAYPVLKNMYERTSESINFGNGQNNISGELLGPNTLRDQVVLMMKDMRRSVDYLATRADIDTTRLGYVGYSWGARVGAIALAVEPRFHLGVLYLAGLMPVQFRPEIDELNFLPRVTVPVLMLSGRYDDVFPLELSAAPYFRLLGTPAAHKRQVIFPTQHFLPRTEQIGETLNWLDRYFGAARR